MLQIDQLHFSIHSTPILQNLTFKLNAGEIVGFVGNNGAGKTTTLEILSQCIVPTSGRITWNGKDIWTADDYRRSMGYVPDQLPLYPNATIRENLLYSAKLRQFPNPHNRVDELIEEFQLSSVSRSPIRTLSKGWRQWTGIAQAWCHKPTLLLLDEPTSGLDPSGRQHFDSWLRTIRSEGTTVFFSSHILSEVEAVSDRVLWIQDGRLIEGNDLMWTIQCIVERPNSSVVTMLQSIEGISNAHIEGNCITLSCHPNVRPKIAQCLVELGLLEMRRIR
jgi:ABC-2 type transport system ATP-binding protein